MPALSQLLETPLGPMLAVANDRGLVLCEFADRPMLPTQMERIGNICGAVVEGSHATLERTQRELHEYFAGTRKTFDVPLVLDGTPFQMLVWRQLLRIGYGATTSYDVIAAAIGRPGAARAVGRANGDNRLAILVPCHRVINADGSLSGYGGGRDRKRRLLALENASRQLAFDAMLPSHPVESSHPA